MTQAELIAALASALGPENVLHRPGELRAYDADGYVAQRHPPRAVVFPESTEQVSRAVKILHDAGVPFLPRGAGTGLSGGATPTRGEVVLSLARMDKLLRIDYENQRAVVQPGFINLQLSRQVAGRGFYYAPDPSSQSVCTLGGNLAENAGGSHCLKYGVTTNHIVAAEVVMPDGEIVEFGAECGDAPGYDLLGLLVGSEGTLGIATAITVRILKKPEAVRTILAMFDRVEDASDAVSAIIAAGIIPAAVEMMDQLAMQAVDRSHYHVGYPTDIEAVLLVEVDGLAAGVEELAERIAGICRECGVRTVAAAKTEAERALWWSSRKMAFGAAGRLAPDYIVQDGVIPRTKLKEVLREIYALGAASGLRIANVFHAGDGNLHPLICYDARVPGQAQKAAAVGSRILALCVDAGGSITGEHGVGIEKIDDMAHMFQDVDIAAQTALRAAFNPRDLCNPGKLIPHPARCAEVRRARAVIERHGAVFERLEEQAAVQAGGAEAPERAAAAGERGGAAWKTTP